ncbi:cytochrome P450 [Vararia minispora EC-137]|uniref:Cytochrome P450 n=1 Tax=Vararia minispora EC-137 TaxID=1314806 RepID=A0ACB8QER3_9AGAM|nr:cytochrome P450 [Vararia minispora EC-137]
MAHGQVPTLLSLTFSNYGTLTALSGLFLVAYSAVRYATSPWRHLPPGPTGYPLLGSALKLLDKEWLFQECKSYALAGELVYLNVAGQPAVVLNSQRVAADLLDRHASTFSDRPRFIVANEVLCGGMFFAIGPDDDRWRRMRRAVHEGFSPAASVRYYGMHAEEAARLALALAKHYTRFTASLVLAITYDRPVLSDASREMLARIEIIDRKIDRATAPGTHLVEFFPWMLMIPQKLARWKREAQDGFTSASAYFNELVEDAGGVARPCLASTLVDNQEKLALSDDEVSWATGTMYAIGSDTLAGALDFWTLAMVSFPETQHRAQEELDAVIGQARPPRVGDRIHLPYLEAVIREALRWRAGLPLGVPHRTNANTWYEGMFIPKGTWCFVNVNLCNRDPAVYGADAEAFNPLRHLDEKGCLKPAPPDTKDEGHIAFGFGKRICIGRYVANDALFAAIATILWAFKLEKTGGVNVNAYKSGGMTLRPELFSCRFTPRFSEALAMLTQELGP